MASFVESSVQQLGKLLLEEGTSLYKVRDKIENLQEQMEWIDCFLREADTNYHQDRLVRRWVSKMHDFAYEAEDIIARYLNGISHHRKDGIQNTLKWFSCIIYYCDAPTLHNLGADIDNLTSKISELTTNLRTYGVEPIRPAKSLEYNAMIREKTKTFSYTRVDVVGLDDEIRKVVEKLMNIGTTVVGISGIGGLGKTTLARKVFKHKVVRDRFNDNCVWVYISKEFDAESIFQEIFLELERGNISKEKSGHQSKEDTKKAGHEGENISKKERDGPLKGEKLIREIHNLVQVKRCLIVLDDIWSNESLNKLEPIYESLRGTFSKILITSRNKGLLEDFDLPADMHLLNALNFENSWELLRRIAFHKHGKVEGPSTFGQKENEISRNEYQDEHQVSREAETKNEMVELGKEMVKHCGGLPIAIVALGGILSTKKTISEWKDVQQNLHSYLISDTEEGSSRISEVMDLSYDDLPYYLKPCFMYLGYFPEDHKISTHKLYQLWEAEGLLMRQGDQAKKQGGSTYDIGERYLNELIQRSMVEFEDCWAGSGRIKTCRVHDIMRDMCLRKCEDVGFLDHIQCSTESDIAFIGVKKLRRCALYDQNGDYVDKHFEHKGKVAGVRSIMLLGSEMSPKIWTSFPLLRVLCLEGIDVEFSVKRVEYLIHLRYLSLRNSRVARVTSCLYDLKYLETLDLRMKDWDNWLVNKFYKMKKLRHLYLPSIYFSIEKLRFPGKRMETLKNFDPNKCEMGELMQMESLRVFSVVKHYNFSDKDMLKRLMETPVMKVSGQLINSFRIQMKTEAINELESNVVSLLAHHPSFSQIIINCYSKETRLQQDMQIFGKSLTRVELECTVGGEVVSALENLQLLKILELRIEDKRVSLSEGSFPKLTQLTLHIDNVEEWVIGDGALPSLQRLKLINCKNLKSDVMPNLPKTLTEVEIEYCVIRSGLFVAVEQLPCLQQLFLQHPLLLQGSQLSLSSGSFPQLFQLSITKSEEMEELEFGDGSLPNLRHLYLTFCEKLKSLMNLPGSITEVKLKKCGMSEGIIISLGQLPRLQKLFVYGTMEGCNKMSFCAASFTSLTELSIIIALGLEELEVDNGSLPNLKRLRLRYCKKLKRIPLGLPASVEIDFKLSSGIKSFVVYALYRLRRRRLTLL